MLTRRQFIHLTGAGLTAAAFPAWARELVTTGGDAFGSYWRLTMPRGADVPRAMAEVIEMIDGVFSPYRTDSDLSRVNRSQDTDWQPVPPEMARLLLKAADMARGSEGAFDPTVGPLVARYGFGPIAGGEGRFAGIDVAEGAMRKIAPDLTLDLCGVAKGRALDLMCEALEAAGIEDFLLDLGGEVAARGLNPAGRSWQVGVDVPGYPMTFGIMLEGGAVATSGSLSNGYRIGDRLFSHIIDPSSREPVETLVRSVSVLAPTAEIADAWATALMAVPMEKALDMAEANALDALILFDDGGALRPVATGAMPGVMLG
ncbi:FAD:protein FMN transferase [Pelagibacterium limicola]|uniref:FAD:protein FMN transferase n=1 Tax=Pelagibacterium limicola TaxID=2791022 RepID=UPI0018AFB2E6|nr:FAD:protein FMN transferase [Pelagibacterium limicola]